MAVKDMPKYRFKIELKTTDYLYSALLLFFNPAILLTYFAVSFLLSWALCSVVTEDFSITQAVLVTACCLYVFMSALFVALVSYRHKTNGDMALKTMGYQHSEISENSYIEVYSATVSEVKWEEFLKIHEHRSYFFLYAMKKKFIILPKRLLPEGCEAFLRALAGRLPMKKEGSESPAASGGPEAPVDSNGIITYLRPQDNMAFQLYNSYVFRKNLIINSALILFFAVVMAFFSVITGEYLMPVIFLLALVLVHLMTLLAAALSGRKYKKEPLKVIYRFEDRGFQTDHRFGKVFVEWGKLYAARQSENHYFLYLSKMQAMIVPKRDLPAGTTAFLDDIIQKYNLREKKQRA